MIVNPDPSAVRNIFRSASSLAPVMLIHCAPDPAGHGSPVVSDVVGRVALDAS